MSTPTSITAPFDPSEANRLLDQFVVSQAADFALSGNYTGAESLIKPLVLRADPPTEALDLLAKICVQQGRVVEAGDIWRRALGKDPTNSACQAALVRLNRMQRRPVWFAILWPAVFALALTVVGVVAMQIQSAHTRAEFARLESDIRQASDTAVKAGDVRQLSQSVEALSIQQAALQRQIDGTRGELKKLTAATAAAVKASRDLAVWLRQNSSAIPLAPPKVNLKSTPAPVSPPLRLDLRIAGVVVTQKDDHWVIWFDKDLFDQNDRFALGSEALLEAVAKKLVQSEQKLTVEIIDTADGDLSATGRPAHAQRVAQFLGGLGIFPTGSLRITSERPADFSLPAVASANQFVNRPVLLKVSPAQELGRQ